MKKLFLVFCFFISLNSLFAQQSFGGYTTSIPGTKHAIGVEILNDIPYIVINYVFSDAYLTFDSESRIVFKFDDDTIVKCPLSTREVSTKTEHIWLSTLNRYVDHYHTIAYYDVPDEIVKLIFEERKPIVKIRTTWGNGGIRDYELKKRQPANVSADIARSYIKANTQDGIRKDNMSKDDSDM